MIIHKFSGAYDICNCGVVATEYEDPNDKYGYIEDIWGHKYGRKCRLILKRVPRLSDVLYISASKGAKEVWFSEKTVWYPNYYECKQYYFCAIRLGQAKANAPVSAWPE